MNFLSFITLMTAMASFNISNSKQVTTLDNNNTPITYVDTRATTTINKGGIIKTSGSNLNIRGGASLNSTIITKIQNGSYVSIINENNGFYYIQYSLGKYGYVSKDYVSILSSSYQAFASTNGSTLNVRSYSGTNYGIIGKLYNNEKIIVLQTSGSWAKIIFNGNKIGYVNTNYIKSSVTTSLKLNVVDLKQYDSRWAYQTIGNSSDTFKKSGCTTTCIAMIESYNKGYTIYPNTMSKSLSYTSTGALYWPQNYKFTTSSTNYLNNIYNYLKNGKPVLFGSKKSSGTQHWVVITGVSKSSSYTAYDFYINDPGSSTRKTLGDFLEDYPYIYKYAVCSN